VECPGFDRSHTVKDESVNSAQRLCGSEVREEKEGGGGVRLSSPARSRWGWVVPGWHNRGKKKDRWREREGQVGPTTGLNISKYFKPIQTCVNLIQFK
jgi:hypothetical protein